MTACQSNGNDFKECLPIVLPWLLIQSTMEYDDVEACEVPSPVILKKAQQNLKSVLKVGTLRSSQSQSPVKVTTSRKGPVQLMESYILAMVPSLSSRKLQGS